MLHRFTLKKSGDHWVLHNQFGEMVREFRSKAEATKDGVLQGLVGEGIVRIHREDGRFEEERTFPRDMDPRRSPG